MTDNNDGETVTPEQLATHLRLEAIAGVIAQQIANQLGDPSECLKVGSAIMARFVAAMVLDGFEAVMLDQHRTWIELRIPVYRQEVAAARVLHAVAEAAQHPVKQ